MIPMITTGKCVIYKSKTNAIWNLSQWKIMNNELNACEGLEKASSAILEVFLCLYTCAVAGVYVMNWLWKSSSSFSITGSVHLWI